MCVNLNVLNVNKVICSIKCGSRIYPEIKARLRDRTRTASQPARLGRQ